MAVLTEANLRIELKDANLDELTEFCVEPGVIVTPAAKAYLLDHKIDLKVGDKYIFRSPRSSSSETVEEPQARSLAKVEPSDNGSLPHFDKPLRFECLGGGFVDEKPEHMTALRGNLLVPKDHKRIVLRGQIDSMDADILQVQLQLKKDGQTAMVQNLEEIRTYLKQLLRCEVLEEAVPEVEFFGLSDAEIREHSHFPKKYYGIHHFAADISDCEAVILLNVLRTKIRELELTAYSTFKEEDGSLQRPEMIQALNRLSSALYVLMLRAKAGSVER